jgi:hypothetical protein
MTILAGGNKPDWDYFRLEPIVKYKAAASLSIEILPSYKSAPARSLAAGGSGIDLLANEPGRED